MSRVLITGANRGIGLEFVRQYLEQEWTVDACCRTPQEAEELQALLKGYDSLSLHALDVTDADSIAQLAKRLEGVTIDLLINNAGVYLGKRTSLGDINYDEWMDSFNVNTLGPIRVVESLLPQIQTSEKKCIVNISSLMGSIADNAAGGSYLYRSSKAALNAAVRSMGIDLEPQGITVIVMHPGWVQTDMGGSSAPLAVTDSVRQMRDVIDHLEPTSTGHFLSFNGKEVPW